MPNSVLLAIVEGVSDKVWIAVSVGILFLILLAIILSVRARRHRAGAPQEPAFAWGDAPPLSEPAIEESDSSPVQESVEEPAPVEEPVPVVGQVHYCRCPACQTQFTVNGVKPIVTNCPGCGKKGYLR